MVVRTPRRWTLALALLAVTAFVGVLALSGPLDPEGVSTDGDIPLTTPAPVPTDESTAVPPLGVVPGVTEAGIVDPVALAAHHDRTLESNYTLWMDLYWRSTDDLADGWHQRDVDVAVADDRYHLRASVDPAGDAPRRRVLDVYRDGDARSAAVYDTDGTRRVRRLGASEVSPSSVPDPAALRSETLADLLDTPLTTYSGLVEREGVSYHRVVATGAPSGSLPTPNRGFVPATAVRNYSAVVLFDRTGRLASVEVGYTVAEPSPPLVVRFRVVYGDRGETTVRRPGWVEAATAT